MGSILSVDANRRPDNHDLVVPVEVSSAGVLIDTWLFRFEDFERVMSYVANAPEWVDYKRQTMFINTPPLGKPGDGRAEDEPAPEPTDSETGSLYAANKFAQEADQPNDEPSK